MLTYTRGGCIITVMVATVESSRGRPRLASRNRRYVNLSAALGKQVEALAKEERRTIAAQIELLIERGLRSYGLEIAA